MRLRPRKGALSAPLTLGEGVRVGSAVMEGEDTDSQTDTDAGVKGQYEEWQL